MQLRPYQSAAVAAIYEHLRTRSDNPCAVLPTGSGKTPVLATIVRDAVSTWSGRITVLAHVKELLEQSAEKIRLIAPDVPLGVYSAGLGQRELGYSCTVAGIQSIWKKADELGRQDLILIDEAHMVPAEDDGMYRAFIADAKKVNPNVRVVGLTATPYRLKSGSICAVDNILNHVCYEVGVRELIVQGYLSPLKTKAGGVKVDTSELHTRAGEFVASEVELLMDNEVIVQSAVEEVLTLTRERNSVLLFASSVAHAGHIAARISAAGHECGVVTGDTPDGERTRTLERFKAGQLKYLANVNVLTTGFDAPNIDCVVLLRPTMSPGLYYQMVGRGFRLHPGKADCLVLDYGENVLRHGPVDAIKVRDKDRGTGASPAKECPQCAELIAAGYARCPECGFVFPPPAKGTHEAKATTAGILSDQVTREECDVQGVRYVVHTKKGDPSAPTTMRVEYRIGLNQFVSEWVCLNHTGFALRKAIAWWKERSEFPVPGSTEEAVEVADFALAKPSRITVEHKAGDHFPRIVSYVLGEKPSVELESEEAGRPVPDGPVPISEDDIPF